MRETILHQGLVVASHVVLYSKLTLQGILHLHYHTYTTYLQKLSNTSSKSINFDVLRGRTPIKGCTTHAAVDNLADSEELNNFK